LNITIDLSKPGFIGNYAMVELLKLMKRSRYDAQLSACGNLRRKTYPFSGFATTEG